MISLSDAIMTLFRVPGIKSFFRTGSLFWVKAHELFFYDTITRVAPGIYLGSMPISRSLCGTIKQFCNNIQQIKEFVAKDGETLGLVVSVLMHDELDGEGFGCGYRTVKKKDWKASKVDVRVLEMIDYELEATVDINEGADIILDMRKRRTQINPQAVYVHCKGGMQRSAMMCAVYLALYVMNSRTRKKFTLDEAVDFLKIEREQVELWGKKMERAKAIMKRVRHLEARMHLPAVIDLPIQHSNRSSFWRRYGPVMTKAAVASMAVNAVCRMMG